MYQRNNYFDLIKFLFSIVIMMLHGNLIFVKGYLAVEGFFMISGYFMMASIARRTPETALSTPRFVFHKYISIFPYLLFSVIVGCIVYGIAFSHTGNFEFFKANLPLIFFELFPLQVAGFDIFCITGVSWYLSAMFLAIAILYPLAIKLRDTFTKTVCPITFLLIWGVLSAKFHTISLPNQWLLEIFNTGLLRGIAGICAGCFLWSLLQHCNEKAPSKAERIVNTVLELLGYALLILIMTYDGTAPIDYLAIPLFMVVIFIGAGKRSLFALFINRVPLKFLGTASTVIYLNHHYWMAYLRTLYPHHTDAQFALRYFAIVFATAAIVWALAYLSMRAFGQIKKRLATNQ